MATPSSSAGAEPSSPLPHPHPPPEEEEDDDDDDASSSSSLASSVAAADAESAEDDADADSSCVGDDVDVDSSAASCCSDDEEGEDEEQTEDATAEALSQLLAALAAGVRAVQGLPTNKQHEVSAADDNDNTATATATAEDDAFSFEKSFPEFAASLQKARSAFLQTTTSALEACAVTTSSSSTRNRTLLAATASMTETTTIMTAENQQQQQHQQDVFMLTSLDDVALWEACADACDALLDQVEQAAALTDTDAVLLDNSTTFTDLQHWSSQARSRYQKSLATVVQGLVDMPQKPQDAFSELVPVQNSRTSPFVPAIRAKPHALLVSQLPLDLTKQMVAGHGLDTRYGALRPFGTSASSSFASRNKPNLVAPSQHVPHVYQDEIQALEYRPFQFQVSSSSASSVVGLLSETKPLEATWIDTEPALQELGQMLDDTTSGIQEMAIDLEAHSYRSFSGLVCLMQISIRSSSSSSSSNHLIDTLALRDCLNQHLQPALANPDICKVMHGADSDVPWLQSNFGLYIVNLFDTGRAARALQFPSASYAYLLQKYTTMQTVDKTHQLSDWRQRPLPESMRQYAIQDTHYLLPIYDCLRRELLEQANGDDSLIRQVLDTSKQVCLIRHAVAPFDPDGYQALLSRRNNANLNRTTRRQHRNELNDLQERVLRGLWDWRDRVARLHDESLAYVCTNKALLRLALASAASQSQTTTISLRTLQSLLNPLPPLVLEHAQEVMDIMKREINSNDGDDQEKQQQARDTTATTPTGTATPVIEDEEDDEIASSSQHHQRQPLFSSAFFKPASGGAASGAPAPRLQRGMMSPVLGTEALYKQAGWMTPPQLPLTAENVLTTTTTSGTDEDDATGGEAKPKRLLSVHASNLNYRASKQQGDNNQNTLFRGGEDGVISGVATFARSVDGMGTVRAAREHSQSPSSHRSSTNTAEEDAKFIAKQIRSTFLLSQKGALPAVLGLMTPTIDMVDDECDAADDNASGGGEAAARAHGGGGDGPDIVLNEKDFPIPRSMREIYKISNRNRRNKKCGSPTPERGVTPTSEKEREEVAQAEALLRERGLATTAYFDDGSSIGSGNPAGKRQRTKPLLSGRESEESVPLQDSVVAASRDEDLAVIQDVGWIQATAESGGGVGGFGQPGTDPNMDGSYVYDYAAVGAIGALAPSQTQNPFFAGAALAGQHNPSAQAFSKPDQRTKKGNTNTNTAGSRSKQKGRQERPEKREGRTHAYRKR